MGLFESLSLYPEAYSYVMQYLRKKPDGKYVIPEKPVEENEGRLNRKYRFRKKKVRLLPEKGTAGSLKIKIPKNKNPEKKNTEKKKSTYYVKKVLSR